MGIGSVGSSSDWVGTLTPTGESPLPVVDEPSCRETQFDVIGRRSSAPGGYKDARQELRSGDGLRAPSHKVDPDERVVFCAAVSITADPYSCSSADRSRNQTSRGTFVASFSPAFVPQTLQAEGSCAQSDAVI